VLDDATAREPGVVDHDIDAAQRLMRLLDEVQASASFRGSAGMATILRLVARDL
jgi:hypothetical protein